MNVQARRVNALRIVSALTHSIRVDFSHCSASLSLPPGGAFEVCDEVPSEGYLELSLNNFDSPSLSVHGWVLGDSRFGLNFDGIAVDLPASIVNPGNRLRGWPGESSGSHSSNGSDLEATGLFIDDHRAGATTILHVQYGHTAETVTAPGMRPAWFSGVGEQEGPPELTLEADSIVIRAARGRAMVYSPEQIST